MKNSLFSGLFRTIRSVFLPEDSIAQPSGWIARMLSRLRTAAGVDIHEGNALSVSDHYKCCRVISETGAMLPLKVYKGLKPRGKTEAKNHPLYSLIHDEPNERMTSFTWRICMFLHLLNWGRHASYIERDNFSKVKALWPVRPDMFRWELQDGKLWFFVTTLQGQQVRFWEDEILYIPGMTIDGLNTMSPVQMHREALGLGKAMESFAATYFGNGSQAGGFLEAPKQLSEAAATRLKKQWEEKHKGVDNAHRIAVLEEGLQFKPSTVPNNDAQFLESRQFQRSEIAGIHRVPPHKIGDLSRSTNNNIEQQDIEFMRDCMGPWFARIEQAMNKCLLLPREKGRLNIEFDVKGFMKGDSAARAAYYKAMFGTASMSPNDIRDAENENPIEGGDTYYYPANMVPVGTVPESPSNPADTADEGDAPKPKKDDTGTEGD